MTDDQPGNRIGRYRLVRLLGAGGVGVVWEAVLEGPRGFRKPVAVKLLAAVPADPVLEAVLVREARLGALVLHPNVVATYELARVEGRWLVAMELVRGPTVAAVLRDGGPLEPSAILDLGVQICAGLAQIHGLRVGGIDAGLVHRDLKPANLLVDPSGMVKIADLGTAGVTGDRTFGGTPRYFSPEQAAGQPTDGRTDLFALGLVLAELATGTSILGERAFRALRSDLLVPAEVDQRVPGLGEVVARCVKRDPDERWPTAHALATALRGLSSGRDRPSGGVSGAPGRPPAASVPAPPDRFVGREAELAELATADERVSTLVGAGGVGKTRLAVELVRRMDGPHGFVDLSDARSADAVCTAVAAALGLRADSIGAGLASRGSLIVVLDNLEQVLADVAPLIDRWADEAPDARFVCTSRTALGLRRERVVTVRSLPIDDAVALFVDRARREVDADEVRGVVARLDCVPLAIELLAARTRWLSVAELGRQLGDRLGVLARGGPDRPARHRSMEACLDASWELLPEWARRACAQLSVFEGGFTLDFAAAVLDLMEAPSTLDVIEHLVDASLAVPSPGGDRVRMPVLIQAYAARHLGDDERLAAEIRHGNAFAELGQVRVRRAAMGSDPSMILKLTSELDNLVAACRRAIDRREVATATSTFLASSLVFHRHGPYAPAIVLGQAALALGPNPDEIEVAVRVATLLKLLSRNDEGRAQLQAVLRPTTGPADRARLLVNLGRIDFEQGRLPQARALHEEALVLAGASGERYLEAMGWSNLGLVERAQWRLDEAAAAWTRSIAVLRELDAALDAARDEVNLALAEIDRGRLEVGREALESALETHRRLQNRWEEGVVLGNLARVLIKLDRLDDAEAAAEAALAIHREFGGRGTAASDWLMLGAVAVRRGDLTRAKPLIDEAVQTYGDIGWARALAYAWGWEAEIARREDRLDTADNTLARAEEVLGGMDEPVGAGLAAVHRARVAIARGRCSEARELLDRGEGWLRGKSAPLELTTAIVIRAELAAAVGDPSAARALLAAARRQADGIAPWCELHREIDQTSARLGFTTPKAD